jgi:hypothetical protein
MMTRSSGGPTDKRARFIGWVWMLPKLGEINWAQ